MVVVRSGSGSDHKSPCSVSQADSDHMRRWEGQLSKFTNVVKVLPSSKHSPLFIKLTMCQGWQYRWFVLEPSAGVLEYYLLEDRNGRCRASQSMAGAVISPSQEDENTFTINFTSGETYKVTKHLHRST